MTPSGIEPATFRLEAQCLNQLRHQQRVPVVFVIAFYIKLPRIRRKILMGHGTYPYGKTGHSVYKTKPINILPIMTITTATNLKMAN
jgi:hypothetical protein